MPFRAPVILVMFLVGAVLFPTPLAHGDGKVFAPSAIVPETPDQRALVVWDADASTETMVIETSVRAAGDAFGWIVPVPAEPEVAAVSPGIFRTLEAVFLPRLSQGPPLNHPAIVITGVLATVLLLAAVFARSRRGWIRGVVYAGLCIFFLLLALLPTLGSPRGLSGGSSVVVLSRASLGGQDVAVLRARSAGDLEAWLTEQGFDCPAEATSIFDAYIAEGWVFVASRVERSSEGAASEADQTQVQNTRPIAMRFKTDAPVYPMRLTAVGSRGLDLELFCFGPSTAQIDAMEIVRSGPTRFDEPALARPVSSPTGKIEVVHQGLRALVGDAPWATHLRANLTPAQMRRDLPLSWGDALESGNVRHSGQSASHWALLIAIAFYLALALGMLAARTVGAPRSKLLPIGAIGIFATITVLIFTPMTMHPVQGRDAGHRWGLMNNMDSLAESARSAAYDLPDASAEAAIAAIRGALPDPELAEYADENPLTGQRPVELDAPGDYTLQIDEHGRAVLRTYDMLGRGWDTAVWGPDSAPELSEPWIRPEAPRDPPDPFASDQPTPSPSPQAGG